MPLQDTEQARWFVEEVQPHEGALRVWLRHRYPTLGDVDDVVHDSYVNLLRRQPGARIAFTKAYLFAAARNAALKVFRKKRLFSDVPVNELPAWRLLDASANVVAIAHTHEEDALIAEAIAQLPSRCRELLELRAIHGLSYAEIAGRTTLSEATVRVQIARGIKKCANFIRDRGVRHDR